MACHYGMQTTVFHEPHIHLILGASNFVIAVPNIGSMHSLYVYSLLHHMPEERYQKLFLNVPCYLFLKFECKPAPCGTSWACLFLSICNFAGHLYLHPSYCHERFYAHFCSSVPFPLLPFFMETLYLYLSCP